MVWYYRESDQEIGPVSKADLQTLIQSKQVNAQTMVRSVEMTDWVPLIDVVQGKVQGSTPPPAPPANDAQVAQPETMDAVSGDTVEALVMEEKIDSPPEEVSNMDMAPPAAGDVSSAAICSQCGRSFPQDQVIAYDDQMICAACKPMFVQRLKEGAVMPTSMAYGGFWIRVLAYIIDTIPLVIVNWVIMIMSSMVLMPSMMQTGGEPSTVGIIVMMAIYMVASIGIPVFYYTFFHGRWGATLGKMACGLKVVTAEGEKITYMRAFGRYFAAMISGMILCIGFMMAGWDDEKRTLHDRICSTRVIKKR